MLYLSRRTSSIGHHELFQDRGKHVATMSALAETEEEEDEPRDHEKGKEPSILPQAGKDKPTPADKPTTDKPTPDTTADPLAALGDKLAKLR